MIMKSSKAQKSNNSRSKIILFDIDYTLFDVSYFDREFYKRLSELWNLPKNEIEEKSTELILNIISEKAYLDIDEYVSKLVKIFDKIGDQAKLENILFKSDFFKEGFYEEVEETLKRLSKITKIGIFSHGDHKLQWAKLDQSGFKDYFDKDIIYIKNKKMHFLPALKEKHLKDKVFLVDDKPKVIDEIKKNMPNVFTIWIRRGKYLDQAKTIDNFKPDATIENLMEVIEIVKEN